MCGFSINAQTVDLQRGLVAYYPFNGNANDESGNGNNGTVYGATLTTDRFSNQNSAFTFANETQYISFPPLLTNSNQGTISIWFYTDIIITSTNPVNGIDLIKIETDVASVRRSLRLGDISSAIDNEIFGVIGEQAPNYPRSGVSKNILNTINIGWHHIVLVSNINGHKYYLDGIEYKPTIFKYWSISSNLFPIVGALKTKVGSATKIDDVRIYNRALSEAEILELYGQNSITDNAPPQITISSPNVSRGFKPVEINSQVTITGKATDASGIFKILINKQEAYVDAQGNFSKTVLLAFGDNSFTVTATDLKQNTSSTTFIIERQSNPQDVVIVDNQTNNTNNLNTGKYYALIIGNNNYQDPAISSLSEPINDATKLYNVLTTQYTFEPQNVTFLKNATYVQMIDALDNLNNKITTNDNLLVFYAGHGWWDDTKNLGYWLPVDARKNSTAQWLRNSTISDYMGSINSKHTLLIADACFSGSIFKTRNAFDDVGQGINSLYEITKQNSNDKR